MRAMSMRFRTPVRAIAHVTASWATRIVVASAGIALLACGPAAGDDGDAAGSTSASESTTSEGTTFELPSRPDLGPDAVICGEPGEYAATDEAFELLAGCEFYQGRIVILNPGGSNLSPLTSLRVIGEDLSGNINEDLANLEGLNQLEWVGSFHFSGASLTDLSAMTGLAGIDDFFQFRGMRELEDCRGLEALRTVGGSASFQINDELTSLDGLSGLEWIGGDLLIVDNPKLESLSGLSSLRQVDGDVSIQLNPLLPPSEVDALLSHVEVGGEIMLD